MATINKKKQVIVCFPLYLYNDDTQTKNGGNGDLFAHAVIASEAKQSSTKTAVAVKKVNQSHSTALRLDCHGANAPRNDEKGGNNDDKPKRQPNFDPKILQKFVCGLGLRFVNDHEGDEYLNVPHLPSPKGGGTEEIASNTIEMTKEKSLKEKTSKIPPPLGEARWGTDAITKPTINPLDILDYIYAVLHSPTYRETYKEFLKIDFPKIPYPTDTQKFWQLVTLGREIRLYHLLEHPSLAEFDTNFPQGGDNKITTKISTKDFIVKTAKTHGKIMINDMQFFDNIPIIAWEFYIGGYQPAQKWLKDRHGRKLNFDDIQHYQKIIKSLHETHKIMQDIDRIL